MYQAIEAISKAGMIQPLEPVHFDENEHLVILRLSKGHVGAGAGSGVPGDWRHWVGALRGSPGLNDDPVALQQAMRDEWK